MKNQIIVKQPPRERNIICEKALTEMTDFFTSNDFAAECRKQGLDAQYTLTGYCGEFLQNAARQLTRKTWAKKNSNITTTLSEDKCIAFLKATGKYKILVKYVEFKEI
jgi:hypothetical protein